MKMVWVVGLVLCLLVSGAFSQDRCYNPCEIPATTCNFVNYPIYPIGLNVTANEQQAGEFTSQLKQLSVSQTCQDAAAQYTCAVLYHSCVNSTVFNTTTQLNETVPIRMKPCRSECTYLNDDACAAYKLFFSFLTPAQQEFINCDRLDQDGSPFFFDDRSIPDAAATGQCYTLYTTTPIDRCTNDTIPPPPKESQVSGCQAYNPAVATKTAEACAPFVSKEIFVPIASNPEIQRGLDDGAYNTTSILTTFYKILPVGCYKRAMSLICQTAFPTCSRVTDNNGTTWEVPNYPCRENCDKALEECGYVLSLVEQYANLINCSTTSNSTGKATWPTGPFYDVNVTSTVSVVTTCATSVFPPNASKVFVLPEFEDCPSVLAKKPNPKDSDIQCWVPCPDPTYTDKQWEDLVTIGMVTSSFSFVMMLFMFITSLVDVNRRKFRLHIPIYFSGMMMGLVFFIGGSHPQTETWCDDPVTYATSSSNSRCGAQAFFFQFFGLACIMWWVVIGYHMFMSVVMHHSTDLKRQEIWYHLFAWGIPFVLTVVTASINSHGFAPPAPWCYIHDNGYQNDYSLEFRNKGGISVDYYTFYIPIGISIAVTFVLLLFVFYMVFTILRTAKSLRKTSGKDLKVQARILTFLVILFILFVLIFEWRFDLEALDTEQIKYDDLSWAICQIEFEFGVTNNTDLCPGDRVPRRINYDYTAFETFLASSFGIWIFLTFGTDPALYRFWWKVLNMRSYEELKRFIKEGVEPERTTASVQLSTSLKTDGSKEETTSKDGTKATGTTAKDGDIGSSSSGNMDESESTQRENIM